MKILFISRMYPNDFNEQNGIVIYKQAEEIRKLGHEVVVLSPTPYTPPIIKGLRKEWEIYSMLPKKSVYKGFKVYRPRFIDLPSKLIKKYSWRLLLKFISKDIDDLFKKYNFDIIHAHMGYPDGRVAIEIKKKYSIPLVTTFRSTDTEKNMQDQKIKSQLYNSLFNSDTVIAPSVPLKRKIEKEFDIKAEEIGNGTDLENRVMVNSSLKNLYKDKRILLSVSTLIESKGIETNIKALVKLKEDIPNILYIIVGDGRERSNLENLVNELTLNKHVKFIGALSNKEVMDYMSICEVFSLPSWRETFGLVYIEAMLNQKPVILCKNSAIEGTVRHLNNGMIIEAKNVNQLVDSIKYLMLNPLEAKAIAKRGEKTVLDNFIWDQIGLKIESVYNNLLKEQE